VLREHVTLRGQILALVTIVLLVLGACASNDGTDGDPSLISTCVETTHTELEGGFPSYLTFTIEVEGVADGTTVSLQADGVNYGEPFEGTVENGEVVVEAGIRSYDDYATPTLVIYPAGAAVSFPSKGLHTVDDAEGEDSQTCF